MNYLTLPEIESLFDQTATQQHFTLRTCGYSREERPIRLLSFMKNTKDKPVPKNLLLYGGEDATEPVFSQTFVQLLEALQNSNHPIHDFPFHWHFISCINPDGYVRNSQWFHRPGDLDAFFEHGWEDPHPEMLFWNTQSPRPETKTLHKVIAELQPALIYNMHDESHFPADGYKFAFSKPLDMNIFSAHLKKVADFMDLSEEELVITEGYGREEGFSVAPALKQSPEPFIVINEACGYKRLQPEQAQLTSEVIKALQDYGCCLDSPDVRHIPELASARFHVRTLLGTTDSEAPFNVKMLALTGHGFALLKKALPAERTSLQHIEQTLRDFMHFHFDRHYTPVPVEQQVLAQYDFLTTLLFYRDELF